MANTSTRGILLTMLSAVTFGFAFTLGPMTYGEAGSNPVTLTFLRNFLSLPVLLAILWYQGISLMVSAISLNIFVFVANPLIQLFVEEKGEEYHQYMERRKQENVEIILSRLRI